MIEKNTRFGHLVVLGAAQAVQVVRGDRICNWSASWCRCDCGATKVVSDWRLRTGHVTSCGCRKHSGLRSVHRARVPRIGTRFGQLTVTAHLPDRIDRRGVHHTRSEFTCSCGRKIALDNSRVRRLGDASCGHDRPASIRNRAPSRARRILLVRPGARFGALAVTGARVIWSPHPVVYAAVRCEHCDHVFETWVENFRRGRLAGCPHCGAPVADVLPLPEPDLPGQGDASPSTPSATASRPPSGEGENGENNKCTT